MTLLRDVRGVVASCSGLKLSRALRIRLEVLGRVLMRIDKQLRVASTTRASLEVVSKPIINELLVIHTRSRAVQTACGLADR